MDQAVPDRWQDAKAAPPTLPSHAGYVAGIDGLRALAVVSVILYHLKAGILSAGFVGVDVFFVISGYVVAKSILGRDFRSFWQLIVYFYARRFMRILPALLVMLLVMSLATVAFVPSAWLSDANRDTAFAAFFGVSNISLVFTSDDYFGPRTDFNPFAHTWSLGVEEQFYLVFPFLISAAVLSRSRQNLSLYAAAILTAASLGISAAFSPAHPVFGFFQIPGRFWELGVGMLLALTATHWQGALAKLNKLVFSAVELVLLVLLVVSFFVCDPRHFPFPWAILPVGATAGLLMSTSAMRGTPVSAMLSLRWVSFVGLISYSLYLWHWPIFALMRWTSGLESAAQDSAAVVLTLAAASASYFLVERPIRYSQGIARLPRFAVVIVFAGAAVAAAFASREMFDQQQRLSLSVTWNVDVWRNNAVNGGCLIFRDPLAIAADLPIQCNVSDDRKLMVVGDSHAGAYARLFSRFSQTSGIPVFFYGTSGCAFLGLRDPLSAVSPVCAGFDAVAKKDLLKKANPSTVIFLPSLRISRLRDQWGGGGQAANAPSPANVVAVGEALEFLKALSATGATVIFEAPTPVFKSPPFRCSDWFNRDNPICLEGLVNERSVFESRRSEIVAAEKYLAGSVEHVFIWDPAQTLCDAQSCNAIADGKPLFYDGDHLSGYGNDVLYPAFRNKLSELAPEFARVR